ncbi:MAG: fumarate hydratase C-terminal domain-containing protein [Candidatus Brockarchaeota archaeon]|nr:fumarate hydratase C-terminal domain-containing protein [Candidatus Brockarchaeota archaeon]
MTGEHKLETPIGKEDVARLRAGDILYISGEVFTSRDRTQKLILENKNRLPFSLHGLIEFHAGPIVRRKDSKWEIVSIGPTTSFRMENNEYEFIRETGIAGVIGKGGMGNRTVEACREFKAFYGVLPGGAAALIAKSVKRIIGVYWLEELGVPEAMWHLEVKELGPITIVIDAFRNDLYENLRRRVGENLSRVLKSLED